MNADNEAPAPQPVRQARRGPPTTRETPGGAGPLADAPPPGTGQPQAREDTERAPGPARKPFGSQVSKLAYPAREGFHRRWFNDEPGRIAQALEASWTHVLDRNGKNVGRVVGTAERGGGLTSFLMEIPLELFNADQALKQEGLDETDNTIMRGKLKEEAGDRRYGDVTMKATRGVPNR